MQRQMIMEELRLLEQRRQQQELLQHQVSSLSSFGGNHGSFSSALSGSFGGGSSSSKFPLSSALLNSISSFRGSGRLPPTANAAGPAGAAPIAAPDAVLMNDLQERIRAAGGVGNLLAKFGLASSSSASGAAAAPGTGTGLTSSVSAPVVRMAGLGGAPFGTGISQDDLLRRAPGSQQTQTNKEASAPDPLPSSLLENLSADALRQRQVEQESAAALTALSKALPAAAVEEEEGSSAQPTSLKKRKRGNEGKSQNSSKKGIQGGADKKTASRRPSSQPLKKRRLSMMAPKDTGTFPQMGKNLGNPKIALDSFRKMWDNVKCKELKKELFLRQLQEGGRTPFSTGTNVRRPSHTSVSNNTSVK